MKISIFRTFLSSTVFVSSLRTMKSVNPIHLSTKNAEKVNSIILCLKKEKLSEEVNTLTAQFLYENHIIQQKNSKYKFQWNYDLFYNTQM